MKQSDTLWEGECYKWFSYYFSSILLKKHQCIPPLKSMLLAARRAVPEARDRAASVIHIYLDLHQLFCCCRSKWTEWILVGRLEPGKGNIRTITNTIPFLVLICSLPIQVYPIPLLPSGTHLPAPGVTVRPLAYSSHLAAPEWCVSICHSH